MEKEQKEKVIKAYKEMYVEEFPDMPVEYGFMEIRKPGIPETIKKLTTENDLDKIIVVVIIVVMMVVMMFFFIIAFNT